ncbi:MAG: hypothetical protein ACK6AT_18830, partial [Planctomycetota bacterium]
TVGCGEAVQSRLNAKPFAYQSTFHHHTAQPTDRVTHQGALSQAPGTFRDSGAYVRDVHG